MRLPWVMVIVIVFVGDDGDYVHCNLLLVAFRCRLAAYSKLGVVCVVFIWAHVSYNLCTVCIILMKCACVYVFWFAFITLIFVRYGGHGTMSWGADGAFYQVGYVNQASSIDIFSRWKPGETSKCEHIDCQAKLKHCVSTASDSRQQLLCDLSLHF